MILVKLPRVVFKVLNFNLLFLNSIVFTYICLQPSEINDIFEFFKEEKSFCSDILIGNIGGCLIFGLIRYTHQHIVLRRKKTEMIF
jgi:hypothetical protein